MTDDESLENELKRRTRFARLRHVASCGSTQDLAAAELADAPRDGQKSGDAVFWADHQTGGRGRQNREWHDEPGLDLAVTFCATVRLTAPTALPAALPVAVLQAAEPFAGRPLRIKWPNDVYLDGKKLAGVLVDRDSRRPDVYRIGIGLNVNRTSFPPPLDATATSLALAADHTFDRGEVLLALAERVSSMLDALEAQRHDQHEALFRARLGLLGQRVEVDAGPLHRGVLTAIDFDRLTLDDGRTVPLAIVRALRIAAE